MSKCANYFHLATYLSHRSAPEVIEEEVSERGRGPQVFVVEDGRNVIKHEPTGQTVPVTPHHQPSQKQHLLPRHDSHGRTEPSLSTAEEHEEGRE